MRYIINEMPVPAPGPLLEKCARVETATVGHRRLMGFVDPQIQNVLADEQRIAGTAVTLAVPGQDATLLHHVVEMIRPGDVLCIDRLGDRKHACVGGGVALAIREAGCIGVVIDGPCTDLPELQRYGLPVWSRGLTPITTRLYDIGGSFNVPISIGGVVVNPGDIVVADCSGVLVMPANDAKEDVDWALAKAAAEPDVHRRLQEGEKIGDIYGGSAKVKARS